MQTPKASLFHDKNTNLGILQVSRFVAYLNCAENQSNAHFLSTTYGSVYLW